MAWATDALQAFDTSVSALAHQLGVSWHTVWDAVRVEASRRIAATERLEGVDALGVDEHCLVPHRTARIGHGHRDR
ncbi:helix-turn-helix domain-containing protein [Arthrobacter oryzae]|uniref:helix-turn-helix domain-containing protein n=1 Tax=Arthrobacter oryzae TaxID=409290 RepID=UPI002181E5D9|nr:helix-turn-helix domain-containing protein [Arthrobacter oryzae]